MFFDTFWALVFGFTISGAIQAFTSRERALASLGDYRPKTIVKASILGAISSNCSYAASAISKNLIEKGADFTTSMVFMFASTNLVFELGLVMWTLIGWQFAAAEFVGGFIMIALLTLIIPRLNIPKRALSQPMMEGMGSKPRSTWHDAVGFTVGDLTMVHFELITGFIVAGLADTHSFVIGYLYLTRNKSEDSPCAKDPICGMQVEKSTAVATLENDGVTHYFCSPDCMETFRNSVPTSSN
jgi:uncharacterized membrane protein YraQ (UPF0718 family)